MYHVPNDRRARRSADRLCRALLDCLENKELHSITVSDLHQASGVSRATFYRLFDTVNDVVTYQCDQIYEGLAEEVRQQRYDSLQDISLEHIRRWLTLSRFMETLVKNNLLDILFQAHQRNAPLIWRATDQQTDLTETEKNYLLCTLIGMLPIMLHAWYLNGQKDTPEEVYNHLKRSLSIVRDM